MRAIEDRENILPWKEKINKAAFYGSLHPYRQIIFDLAVTVPDLIEAHWTGNGKLSRPLMLFVFLI